MAVTLHSASFAPIDAPLRARLEALETALLSDAMGGRQTMDGAIRPLRPGLRMIGQARTALSPGGNRAAVVATPLCRPGEVLVVDGGGGGAHATWGGITTREAMRCDLAGCVIDGAIRDAGEIAAAGFPMFHRSVTPRGPGPLQDGAIDAPIVVGGARVRPGDIVFGDDDGVVVIPLDQAEDVIAAAEAKQAREAGWIAAIEAGGSLAEALGLPPAHPARD